MPCRHGQDPLPATPGVNDPGPAAAGDPHPARAPAGLLRPGDHHGATRDLRQDRAKARLSPGAHRKSYARRTGAERTFSTAKDPASNNIARGWTRLMGLAPLMLWLACLLVARNQRILTAWDARQDDNARRAAAGLPPRTHRPAPQNPHRPGHRRHPALTRRRTRHRHQTTPGCGTPDQPTLPRNSTPGTPQPRNPPTTADHAKCQAQT